MTAEPPLVVRLPRQPGTKEARYAHLLSADVSEQSVSSQPHSQADSSSSEHDASVAATYTERLIDLEREVIELRSEVSELKQQLAAFQKQFQ